MICYKYKQLGEYTRLESMPPLWIPSMPAFWCSEDLSEDQTRVHATLVEMGRSTPSLELTLGRLYYEMRNLSHGHRSSFSHNTFTASDLSVPPSIMKF